MDIGEFIEVLKQKINEASAPINNGTYIKSSAFAELMSIVCLLTPMCRVEEGGCLPPILLAKKDKAFAHIYALRPQCIQSGQRVCFDMVRSFKDITLEDGGCLIRIERPGIRQYYVNYRVLVDACMKDTCATIALEEAGRVIEGTKYNQRISKNSKIYLSGSAIIKACEGTRIAVVNVGTDKIRTDCRYPCCKAISASIQIMEL